jgi:tRNA(Ile)-lysidine synthase
MQLTPDDKRLLDILTNALSAARGETVGVAVSGGGDSMALLHLMSIWAADTGVALKAVTVDHGLRPEAADEANAVAMFCQTLGVSHTTLKWQVWDGIGNLQDKARQARYALMAGWAQAEGVAMIALGHTMDDQAETFLMRLAREAGVDGLAGMAASRNAHGATWQRPLLSAERQDLREYLRRKDISWVEDPSNEDEKYDRIKARKVMQALAPLGIDAGVLARVTSRLTSARHALEYQAANAARDIVTIAAGDICFDRKGFTAQPSEIRHRLLVHAIKWVASAGYGPRGSAVLDVLSTIAAGENTTLHGCRILAEADGFRVSRELQAVKATRCKTSELWDGRWRLSGANEDGLEIAVLGEEGLKQCVDWRESGLPRSSLLASPAVWNGATLVAAPLAKNANGWVATIESGENHFFKSIKSH